MNLKILFILSLCLVLNAEELITSDLINRAGRKYGSQAKNRFVYIKNELLHKIKNKSDLVKLNFVNTKYNKIKYMSDKRLYNQDDYWATLYQFVGKNGGDCEDYVIAKYYTLKALGVDPHKMKFLYVVYKKRNGKRKSHMVLAYLKRANPKGRDDYLILDNNNRLVLPASKRANIIKIIGMVNGDTGPKSRRWKQLELDMKRKKL